MHLVIPLRGFRYRISTASVRDSRGDNVHYLTRYDIAVGAHAHLTAYTRVLGPVPSLSEMIA
jgi:hypothetical protein